MARATQLRLTQITGSFGTTLINDQIAAAATGSIASTDFETIVSHLAGAIKRIHGDDSFSESNAGEFHQDLKLNTTKKLQFTDSGVFIHASADGQLHLESDGNSADAINITTSNAAGGIDIDSGTGGIALDSTGVISIDAADDLNLTVTSSGAGEDLTISQVGGNDSSIIITAAGTGTDAVKIDATAGSMLVGPSIIDGKTIKIGPAGAAQISIEPHGTPANEKITITNTAGTAGAAIKLEAVAGGITLNAASTAEGLKLATGTSGVPVEIGHSTSEVTIGDNLTVTGNVVVAGDFITQGTTTTLTSSNTVIQDPIIGIGTSGSEGYTPDGFDVGIIFGQGSISSFQRALFYDDSQDMFVLGKANASPASGTFGTVTDANLLSLQLGQISFDPNNSEKIASDGNDITITSGRDIVFDAAQSVQLSFDGGPETSIQIKDGTTQLGHISGTLAGDTKGLIISSSNQGSIQLDANNGSIIWVRQGTEMGAFSGDGSEVTFGAGNNQDLIFYHDQFDGSPSEVFRIDESAVTLAMPANNATGNQASTGLLSFNGTTDQNEAIYGDGSRLYLRSNAVNFKMPTAVGTANQVLADTGGNGTLGFVSVAAASNITRTNMVIATAIASGSEFNPNAVNVSNTAPSTKGDLDLSGITNGNAPNHLDLFVNGQLLLSGSDANVGAGSADYFMNVHSVASRFKFAFGLEVGDVISVLTKA